MMKTDLISLSPDDEPAVFYQKLTCISEKKLEEELERFKRYARYTKLLKFQVYALRRPEMNVQLTYNNKYGWHSSSCIRSLADEEKYVKLDKCTCEADFDNPKDFFDRINHEIMFRCKLCKRHIPEWEEVAGIEEHDKFEKIQVERQNEKSET